MFQFLSLLSIVLQNEEEGFLAVVGTLISLCCSFAIVAVLLAAQWKLFVKAGRPGWAALIPIYNLVVLLEIVGRPLWFIVLFLIPFVNIIASILLAIDVAFSYGKDIVYAIFLILLSPLAILILGFGDAQYVGPGAAKNPIYPAN